MATFVGHRTIASTHGSNKLTNVNKDHNKLKTTALVHNKPNEPSHVKTTTKSNVSFRDIVVRSIEPMLSSNTSYIEYEIEMANQKTGLVWSIRRRYSKFLELQHEIDIVFESNHCLHCSKFFEQVQNLELPPKTWGWTHLWTSPEADTKMRARLFHIYLNGLIELGCSKIYRQCPLVAENFLKTLLTFLAPASVLLELNKLQPPKQLNKQHKHVPTTTKSSASLKPTGSSPAIPNTSHILRRKNSGKNKVLETIFEQETPVIETIVC